VKVVPGSEVARSPASERSIAAPLFRHRLFVVVLVPAVVLRGTTMLGFRWILWFNDSYQYLQFAVGAFRPDPTRPSGYSVYLRLLEPLHSFAVVAVSQHLMGLGIGVMIYALLVHRFKVPLWIATLAAVPALYDAYQIQLEHLLMADTLFAFLLSAAITVAMWRPKPGIAQMAAAGLLLGLAAVTRSVGLPLLGVLIVYMFIRRAGLRAIAAGIVACAVPVAGYMLWFNAWYNQFAMTQSTGVFLYARVMAFADCRKLALPVDEEALCTSAPPSRRLLSQDYIWDHDAPLRRFPPPEFSPLTNRLAKGFATRAIKTQPLDYARVVWDDSWRSFDWKRKVFPDPITYGEYVFASASGGPAQKPATGHGFGTRFSVPHFADGSGITHVVSPYAGIMRGYQKYVFLPGTILGVLLAIGLGGMAVAWRRLGGEILLPLAVAVAMIVLPAATAEFDYRYLLPVVPFACLATGMVFGAGHPIGDRLAARRARRVASAGVQAEVRDPAAATCTVLPAQPADVAPDGLVGGEHAGEETAAVVVADPPLVRPPDAARPGVATDAAPSGTANLPTAPSGTASRPGRGHRGT
jgi:hypothetical protein